MGREGKKLSPDEIQQRLTSVALGDVIQGVPVGTTSLLASNKFGV